MSEKSGGGHGRAPLSQYVACRAANAFDASVDALALARVGVAVGA